MHGVISRASIRWLTLSRRTMTVRNFKLGSYNAYSDLLSLGMAGSRGLRPQPPAAIVAYLCLVRIAHKDTAPLL
jgi:hypothetical protein